MDSRTKKVLEARWEARKILMKRVGLWVAVLAFFGGMLLSVVFGGNAEHQSGLAFFLSRTSSPTPPSLGGVFGGASHRLCGRRDSID